jgi:hypothetical protein
LVRGDKSFSVVFFRPLAIAGFFMKEVYRRERKGYAMSAKFITHALFTNEEVGMVNLLTRQPITKIANKEVGRSNPAPPAEH